MEKPTVPGGKFLGRNLAGLSGRGFRVDVSTYLVGDTFPRHQHERPFFCWVQRGLCLEQADYGTSELSPKSLVYHGAGSTHEDTWHTSGRCLHVELASELADRMGTRGNEATSRRVGSSSALMCMNGIYREIASNDEFSGIAIEGLVLTLLAATLRDPISPMRAPSWLIDVRHELLQKLTKTVCLRNLAKGAGVAPSYLAAAFHKHFGMTVGEFVRRTRAEKAQDLLENGSLPLGEIAILLGYSDQSHFTRSFKALRGVTPSEWRRLKGRR